MMIYFDNAATTKPFNFEGFLKEYFLNGWHNPSAVYTPALNAAAALTEARAAILRSVGLPSGTLIFTSGGTEANNTAVFAYPSRRHFITSAIEHSSVAEAFSVLQNKGHDVTYIRPRADFSISAADVAAAVRQDTAFVSIMHANNETGAINDIAAISAAVKRVNPRTVVHCDGVQAYMKIPVNLANIQVDLYSLSAHKINALKGTGALIAKNTSLIKPFIVGGGQESNLRSGTENTLGILFFAKAAALHSESMMRDTDNILAVRRILLDGMKSMGAVLNLPEHSLPNIINASILGIRAQTLVQSLGAQGIYISNGSACSAKKNVGSRVLKAQGMEGDRLLGAVRISLGAANTVDEAEMFLEVLEKETNNLRRFQKR